MLRIPNVLHLPFFAASICCFAVPVAAAPMPWKFSPVSDPAVQNRCDRLYTATQRLAHHLLTGVHPWPDDPQLKLITESRSNENCIRPNTGTVAGLAFLYRFGPYDEKIVGVSRDELRDTMILPMMRYLTTTHLTGSKPTSDGKPWGDHWQSAFWTSSLGMAAWWLDDDLPGDLAAAVNRVVAHEAEHFVAAEPPHQIKIDTKAEENAWNSRVLSAAIVLMPDDPRRPQWEAAFHKWALSSFLRPADEHATTLVDGRPIAEQFTGANIHDDFTLENHAIVHPDYMTTWNLTLVSSLEFVLTGRRPPEALAYNAAGLYENLKWFTLPDGGFIYPGGQDWTVYRHVDWIYPHVLMATFGRDPEAWPLADRCLDVLEKMQARTPTGTIYLPEENFFASAQTDKLRQFAQAWLALHFARPAAAGDPADPAPCGAGIPACRLGVRRLEHARIILNRTPTATHTLSWGNKLMAQCVPMRKDRLISPHLASAVGTIRLEGDDKPLPVKLVDIQLTETTDAFTAELVIDHGQAVRARRTLDSRPDGALHIREQLTALEGITTTEIATGLVGILNDQRWIYQRGERKLTLDNNAHTIPACSGKTIRAEARTITIDSRLIITSQTPLRARYQAATKPTRGRTTDELTLNTIESEQQWHAGQTISTYEATFNCPPER